MLNRTIKSTLTLTVIALALIGCSSGSKGRESYYDAVRSEYCNMEVQCGAAGGPLYAANIQACVVNFDIDFGPNTELSPACVEATLDLFACESEQECGSEGSSFHNQYDPYASTNCATELTHFEGVCVQ